MATPNPHYFTMKTFPCIVLSIFFVLSASKPDPPFSTSLVALRDKTLNAKTCYGGISPLIDSRKYNDTQFLYNLSVQLSMNEISKASNLLFEQRILTATLDETSDKVSLSALESCREFLSSALYNLNQSLPTSIGALKASEIRTNFRTWLSAARADLRACTDGFESDDFRKIVLANLDKSTELVTTSLAILSKIDDYISPREGSTVVNSGQRTGDWGPTWLSDPDKMLLYNSKERIKPDVVVAADGSGHYTTISEAVKAVPSESDGRFVIYVKKGVYNENVRVEKDKWNVVMYGDGMHSTIVSGNLSHGSGISTYMTATFAAIGREFLAMDMGFRNTAGDSQAVALFSASDQSVFYRCSIEGYQDTLCTQSNRQFYRDCQIYGTIDFIFGDAAVVIQNSDILVRKSSRSHTNYITAQGKDVSYTNTGISIQKCNITAAENLDGVTTFLGRPWKNYSTTVIMESHLGRLINPRGWSPWNRYDAAPDTLLYVEYNNDGPGADTTKRVPWKGLRIQDTKDDSSKFTVSSFINGQCWIPSTGVPFQAGL